MLRKLVYRLLNNQIIHKREPDLIIGPPDAPSMERWRILRSKLLGIYVHRFLDDDPDDQLHDHPWASLSWLVSGQVIEVTQTGENVYNAGKWIYRSALFRHRILLGVAQVDTVTLFFVGRKARKWGYWDGDTFVPSLMKDDNATQDT